MYSSPPPLPIPSRPQNQRSWSVASVLGILLLVLLLAGLAAASFMASLQIPLHPAGDSAGNSASLLVEAADGTDLMVWLEREGQPGRIVQRKCDVEPGKVALRITRMISENQTRSDIVRLTLKPGCRHMVVVGDVGVGASVQHQSAKWAADSHFPAPGVLCSNDAAGKLITANDLPAGFAAVDRSDEVSFSEPQSQVSPHDHALIVVNPYPDAIDCRVIGDGWEHEIGVAGPAVRVVGVGSSRKVRVVCRMAADDGLIEDRSLELPADAITVYTIGGRTAYRWTISNPSGDVQANGPPVPRGWLTALPPDASVRLSADPAGDRRFLTLDQWHGADIALTPLAICPLPTSAKPLGPITIRGDFKIAEISPPGASSSKRIACLATNGSSIVGVIDGVAIDLASGKPLHAATDAPVINAAYGDTGLLLITPDAAVCRIEDRKLVPIQWMVDPTVQVFPVYPGTSGPGLWTFGGILFDGLQIRELNPNSVPTNMAFNFSGLTALAPTSAQDNGLLLARGRRIDRVTWSWLEPQWPLQPVLSLPDDPKAPIIGLADVGGHLFFSTPDSIFTVQDNLVLPIVDGIGGRLFAYKSGLLVHDAATGRVLQITFTAPTTQAEASQ